MTLLTGTLRTQIEIIPHGGSTDGQDDALITLLLASLTTAPAWGQDDSDSDDQGIEASDQFANAGDEESAADQAAADEDLEDEAVLEEIADMDGGDEADETGDGEKTADDDASPEPTGNSETPPDTTRTAPPGCRTVPTARTAGGHPLTDANGRRTGTVKIFDETKGFGNTVDNSSKQEIFVHAAGLIGNICSGDVVTFEIEQGRRGLTAVDVRLL